jgi:hypothetical protein
VLLTYHIVKAFRAQSLRRSDIIHAHISVSLENIGVLVERHRLGDAVK